MTRPSQQELWAETAELAHRFGWSLDAILDLELQRVGAAAGGSAARSLFDLSRPDLDFAALAHGMGVPAARAADAGQFADELRRALAEPGPHLIEAMMSR